MPTAPDDSEPTYTGSYRQLPMPDPPGWVEGVPTSGRDQSCAFCGADEVSWVHPLARDRIAFRQYGKGHTLPTFWCTCDRCEQLLAARDFDAVFTLMTASPSWDYVPEADFDECVRQPLEVFRRADLGPRRLTR